MQRCSFERRNFKISLWRVCESILRIFAVGSPENEFSPFSKTLQNEGGTPLLSYAPRMTPYTIFSTLDDWGLFFICFSFSSLRTDGDICHQERDTEIVQNI
jgi:hypothetical protein